MTDHGTLLQRLILASEAALAQRSVGTGDYVADLVHSVCLAGAKPAPDGRVIHPYTEMLAQAVAMAEAHRHHDGSRSYCRIIGVHPA
jgi:hypothetical protein